MQKTCDITSNQALSWAKRIEVHRAQKAMLTIIEESRDFDFTGKKLSIKENVSSSQSVNKGRCQYWQQST